MSELHLVQIKTEDEIISGFLVSTLPDGYLIASTFNEELGIFPVTSLVPYKSNPDLRTICLINMKKKIKSP